MATSLKGSGQKFIARNRAPRVQIEYDVEIYGAERKIQLPFVMGVLADLAGRGWQQGQPHTPLPTAPGAVVRQFLQAAPPQLQPAAQAAHHGRCLPPH